MKIEEKHILELVNGKKQKKKQDIGIIGNKKGN